MSEPLQRLDEVAAAAAAAAAGGASSQNNAPSPEGGPDTSTSSSTTPAPSAHTGTTTAAPSQQLPVDVHVHDERAQQQQQEREGSQQTAGVLSSLTPSQDTAFMGSSHGEDDDEGLTEAELRGLPSGGDGGGDDGSSNGGGAPVGDLAAMGGDLESSQEQPLTQEAEIIDLTAQSQSQSQESSQLSERTNDSQAERTMQFDTQPPVEDVVNADDMEIMPQQNTAATSEATTRSEASTSRNDIAAPAKDEDRVVAEEDEDPLADLLLDLEESIGESNRNRNRGGNSNNDNSKRSRYHDNGDDDDPETKRRRFEAEKTLKTPFFGRTSIGTPPSGDDDKGGGGGHASIAGMLPELLSTADKLGRNNSAADNTNALASSEVTSAETARRSLTRRRPKKKSSEMSNRPRRRRRWTDDEGTPSFLAILTSDTPPPSDDEDEVQDRLMREKEWKEHGRFVVDVDALLGLAPPTEYVVKDDSSDNGDGGESKNIDNTAGGSEVADCNSTTKNDDDNNADENNKPRIKVEKEMKGGGKSPLYRIGSDIRARIWDAAVRSGSVPPSKTTNSDVALLSDATRAADPFLALPGIFHGSHSSHTETTALTAHGIPAEVKSASFGVSSTSASSQRFYEGVIPLSLPDDEDYLPELHCMVRRNLELFSATEADVADKAYGKRTPIVRGKVGIRCLHCHAAAVAPDVASSSHNSAHMYSSLSSPQRKTKYVGGSVSYISSLSSLSNIAGQKPSLHFASCPNTPPDVKNQFRRLTHGEDGLPLRQRSGAVICGKLGISPTKYWLVAARRVGLVDVKSGGGGIRFARNPSLPPRTIDEVLAEDPTLGGQRFSAAAVPLAALSSSSQPSQIIRAGAEKPPGTQTVNSQHQHLSSMSVVKIKGDDKSEKVLQDVIAEVKTYESQNNGNNDAAPPYLVTSNDASVSSDFSFLLASQLAVVHASSSNVNSRGKKARSVRTGCAGFTCRSCLLAAKRGQEGQGVSGIGGYETGMAYSSFPSGDMALCTTLSQTLYHHWQKCPFIKIEVRHALVAYKRLHGKQNAQLPRGSNGRFYKMLWARLKSMDKSQDEMVVAPSSHIPVEAPGVAVPSAESASVSTADVPSQPVSPNADSSASQLASTIGTLPSAYKRPAYFPVSRNEQTVRVLATAREEKCDEILLLPEEESLVTDFVVLVMKQLAPCQPMASDMKFRRKVGKSGLCCKRCNEQGRVGYGGSGRTFPSAPDNLATSLKEGMFNHLVQCELVPEPIKHALNDLKSLHFDQMAFILCGAQRQYLRILYQRLTLWAGNAPTLKHGGDDLHLSLAAPPHVAANNTMLQDNGFAVTASGWYGCLKCRMVPMDLRAAGSLSQERPDQKFLQQHYETCTADSFDLSSLMTTTKNMVESIPGVSVDLLKNPAFKEFVRSLVGGNDILSRVFTDGIVELDRTSSMDSDSSAAKEGADKLHTDETATIIDSKGLWAAFPARIDVGVTTERLHNLLRDIDVESTRLLRNSNHFKEYIRIVAPSCVDLTWMQQSEMVED